MSFPIDQTAPDAPSNLTSLPSDGSALLSWNYDDLAELANFKIYAGTNSENLTLQETIENPSTNSFTLSNLFVNTAIFGGINSISSEIYHNLDFLILCFETLDYLFSSFKKIKTKIQCIQ